MVAMPRCTTVGGTHPKLGELSNELLPIGHRAVSMVQCRKVRCGLVHDKVQGRGPTISFLSSLSSAMSLFLLAQSWSHGAQAVSVAGRCVHGREQGRTLSFLSSAMSFFSLATELVSWFMR